MRFKKGDKVKMSESLKAGLIGNSCKEHLDEFGECIGIVGGKMFPKLTWQEDDAIDVYWQPSNLHYLYSDDDLEYVEKEI